jgi:hypothetical protein
MEIVGSSDLESKVLMKIKPASRGSFVGTTLILPMFVGGSDLGSEVLADIFQLQKDRFEKNKLGHIKRYGL